VTRVTDEVREPVNCADRPTAVGPVLFSLIATLLGRLFFLQVVDASIYTASAKNNGVRHVTTAATRGVILDQTGAPLVANRSSLVVSVDRATLDKQKDKGKAALANLAKILGTNFETLWAKTRVCGADKGAKGPACWNGTPFQPIPVAKDVTTDLALRILENTSSYPGIQAQVESLRQYPSTANAAQLLGYESKNGGGLTGLEREYNTQLSGTPGVTTLNVNISAQVTGTASVVPPVAGDTLVLNIDGKLQTLVEQQLLAAITRARTTTDPTTKKKFVADSGAAVVLDTTNGHVLAMASYPTYNPTLWVGGITSKEFNQLNAPAANQPLISRAMGGGFAPASTFKITTTSAALMNGYSQNNQYACPSSLKVGGRNFFNDEGESKGQITFKQAIEFSCDTVYYGVAQRFWTQDGGLTSNPKAVDTIEQMAKAYGFGRQTGVDLPDEYSGVVGGRAARAAYVAKYRPYWCKNQNNPNYSLKLRSYWADDCRTGTPYQVGDELNLAIGQGDTLVTPLQMAQAYAALANGGTIYQPQVAAAMVSPTGTVTQIAPKVTGRIPVSQDVQNYLRDAFASTTTAGTAAPAFAGFPLAAVGGVATKTGTGQVQNKQATSWFASYAPANKPKYAVVMMVSQGGYGFQTSGASVRKIYEGIFGVTGSTVNKARSVFAGGAPATVLPKIGKSGQVIPDPTPKAPVTTPPAGAGGPSASPGVVTGAATLPFGAASLLFARRRRRARFGPSALSDDRLLAASSYERPRNTVWRMTGGP
jgi:penicillin-binding protein 2